MKEEKEKENLTLVEQKLKQNKKMIIVSGSSLLLISVSLLIFLTITLPPIDVTLPIISIAITTAIFLIFYILLYPKKITQQYFMELIKTKNAEELITIASSFSYTTNLALYALADIRYPDIEKVFSANLKKRRVKGITSTVMSILKLKNRYPFDIPDSTNIHSDYSIKIAKVYFIDQKTDLGKCMISKISLSIDMDITICPFCGKMAKRTLLENWLQDNPFCPICRKDLIINDCPQVEIKD